jgi:hypothetical protein
MWRRTICLAACCSSVMAPSAALGRRTCSNFDPGEQVREAVVGDVLEALVILEGCEFSSIRKEGYTSKGVCALDLGRVRVTS